MALLYYFFVVKIEGVLRYKKGDTIKGIKMSVGTNKLSYHFDLKKEIAPTSPPPSCILAENWFNFILELLTKNIIWTKLVIWNNLIMLNFTVVVPPEHTYFQP